MAVEHVLDQQSKESAKWTAHKSNINEYVSVNAAEPGNSSGKIPQLKFFSVIKEISADFFSQRFKTDEAKRMRPEISKRPKRSDYA